MKRKSSHKKKKTKTKPLKSKINNHLQRTNDATESCAACHCQGSLSLSLSLCSYVKYGKLVYIHRDAFFRVNLESAAKFQLFFFFLRMKKNFRFRESCALWGAKSESEKDLIECKIKAANILLSCSSFVTFQLNRIESNRCAFMFTLPPNKKWCIHYNA